MSMRSLAPLLRFAALGCALVACGDDRDESRGAAIATGGRLSDMPAIRDASTVDDAGPDADRMLRDPETDAFPPDGGDAGGGGDQAGDGGAGGNSGRGGAGGAGAGGGGSGGRGGRGGAGGAGGFAGRGIAGFEDVGGHGELGGRGGIGGFGGLGAAGFGVAGLDIGGRFAR